MRIDAHHHLWDLGAIHYPWLMERGTVRFFGDPTPIRRDYSVAEFRADASAQGIGASVHIQVGAADGLAEARWVQAVADATPGWPAAQVAFCDLAGADRGAVLDALQALPSLRGVRQIIGRAPGEDAATGSTALLESAAFAAGLRDLAARGLSFDLQLVPSLMAAAAALLARLPALPVALCHAGSPHDRSPGGIAHWRHQLAMLAALPNSVCKISGLGMFEPGWTVDTVRPIVDGCLDLFGPDRCLFGSNFPVDSLSCSYADLYARHATLLAPLSATERAAVLGGTARRFYRLDLS